MPSNHVRHWMGPKILMVILFSSLGNACDSTTASCPGDSCAPESPPPPASLSELFGANLLTADGTAVGVDALQGKPIIAIYFGARGCPACAAFTPVLIAAYEELRATNRSFEVVYVSSDGSAAIMHEYMREAGMPWLAMPWGGNQSKSLSQRYGVRWIPTVIVINGTGATVSLKGREEIASRGASAYNDWLQ